MPKKLLCLLILFLLPLLVHPTHAQEAASQEAPSQPGALSAVNPQCIAVDAWLQDSLLPHQWIQGGDVLRPASTVTAAIAATDAGDRWLLPALQDSSIELSLESDLPLHVRGLYQLTPFFDETLPAGSHQLRLTAPATGLHSLIISRVSLTDSTQTGNYSLQVPELLPQLLPLDSEGGLDLQAQGSQPQTWIFYNRALAEGTDVVLPLLVETDAPVQVQVLANDGSVSTEQVMEVGTHAFSAPLPRLTSAEGNRAYYGLRIVPQGSAASVNLHLDASTANNRAVADPLPFQTPRRDALGNTINTVLADGMLNIDVQASVEGGAPPIRVQAVPDLINSITAGSSLILRFPGESGGEIRLLRGETEAIALLDGDLGLLLPNGKTLYVQGYDWRGAFTDGNQVFSRLTYPDGRETRLEWGAVQQLALAPQCIGVRLQSGQHVLAEAATLRIETQADGSTLINAMGQYSYQINVEWQSLDRVIGSGGNVFLDFDGYTHSIRTQQQVLSVRRSETEAGPVQVVSIEGQPYITTDWVNLSAIAAMSDHVIIETTTSQGTIERYDRSLQQLLSEDGAILLQWADGGSSLLLRESEDFLQLEAPADSSYDPTARPGEAGYLPSLFNNVGLECAPVNRVFPYTCGENGSVNPANGNLSFSITDLYAPAYRLDLALTRTYNSQNAALNGPFGFGWHTEYLLDYDVLFGDDAAAPQTRYISPDEDYRMALDVAQALRGQILLRLPSGSAHLFRSSDPVGSFRAATLPGWEILPRSQRLTDPWELVRGDGLRYRFDPAGRLQAITHPQGGSLRVLPPGAADATYSIQDDLGRRLALSFDEQQHISRAALYDMDSTLLAETRYHYDAEGYLTAVDYSDGSRAEYRYAEGRMVASTDVRHPIASELSYSYDSAGRIRSLQLRDSAEVLARYSYENNNTAGNRSLITTVIDQHGGSTRWRYAISDDPMTNYQLLGVSAAGENETTFTYEAEGTLLTRIDYPTHLLNLAYSEGRVSSISNPSAILSFAAEYTEITLDGTERQVLAAYSVDDVLQASYTYDEQGRLQSFTTAEGAVYSISRYDERFGLPSEIQVSYPDSSPAEESIRLFYDERGDLIERQDASGTHRFAWDSFGRLTSYTDPLGRSTESTYDDSTRCSRTRDPLNVISTACYDSRQRLQSQRMEAGGEILRQVEYEYDALDRLTAVHSGTDAEHLETTRYEYMTLGGGAWQLQEQFPDGSSTLTEYDSLGRVTRFQDRRQGEYLYRYEENAVSVQQPNGETLSLSYNLGGQLCSLGLGDLSLNLTYGVNADTCNAVHRNLARISIPNQLDIRYGGYSPQGLLQSMEVQPQLPLTNPAASLPPVQNGDYSYQYDSRGRLTELRRDNLESITYSYQQAEDSAALQVEITRNAPELAPQSVVLSFDALQRLVVASSEAGTLRYRYTELPEQQQTQVSILFGPGQEWHLFYNALGNLAAWEDHNGILTRYRYNALGYLVEVSVNDLPIASYEYNAAGQVTAIVNMHNQVHRFAYNDKGQLASSRDYNNVVQIYTYDQIGRLSTITDALGNTTTFVYDATSQQLSSIIDPGGNSRNFRWEQSPNGQQLIYQNGTNEIRYSFDVLGRLWGVEDTRADSHFFHYDALGRLDAFLPGAGALHLSFSYGLDDQLLALSDQTAWQWQYSYDAWKRLLARQDPNGHSINFGYDALGRLTGISMGDYNRIYQYPEAGTIDLFLANEQTRLHYDDFYRLTERSLLDLDSPTPVPFSTSYQYTTDASFIVTDPFGRQSNYSYATLTGLDREVYLTVTHAGSIWQYLLNARGELVEIIRQDQIGNSDSLYTRSEEIRYDAFGRPIRYIDGEANLYAYTYDAAGNLTALQNPDGARFAYEYDEGRRLTRIVDPTDQALSLRYNALGQLTEVSLENEMLESYEYHPLGWLEARTINPSDSRLEIQRDAAGNIIGWNRNSGQQISLERSEDAFARLLALSDGDTTLHTYSYDGQGRLLSASAEALEQEFAYDLYGRLLRWQQSQRAEVWNYSYAEDGLSYEIAIQDGSPRQLRFQLDEHLRFERLVANETPIDISYSLRPDNRLELMLLWGDGYSSQLRFNSLGHVLRVVHERREDITFDRTAYTYSLNYLGLPQSIDETTYDVLLGYDSIYHPLTARWLYTGPDMSRQRDSVAYAFTMTYDELGNRRTELLQDAAGTQTLVDYDYAEEDGSRFLLRSRRILTDELTQGAFLLLGLGFLLSTRRRRVFLLLFVLLLPALAVTNLMAQEDEAQALPGIHYHYDADGNLAEVVNDLSPERSYRFRYDAFGRLTEVAQGESPISSFSYDAFGRLIQWESSSLGSIHYRYNDGRLAQIQRGDDTAMVLSLPQMPLKLLAGAGHDWLLFDGVQRLRKGFRDSHAEGAANLNLNFFGVPILNSDTVLLSTAMPIFNGMIYDPDSGIYLSPTGRAYDPGIGRYLQPDRIGPDAVGNLYNYRQERTTPPVQVTAPYPFLEGLTVLAEAQQPPTAYDAASVLALHQPPLSLAWQDAGLSSLAAFNQRHLLDQFASLPAQVSSLNPAPGVLRGPAGNFRLGGVVLPAADENPLAQATFTVPGPTANPYRAVDELLAASVIEVPDWYAPQSWHGATPWQQALSIPQPSRGQPRPDAVLEVLPLRLNDIHQADALAHILASLPTQDTAQWLEEIDALTLPHVPETPPLSAIEWLEQWFTEDTLPVWAQLRQLRDVLPPAPATPLQPYDLSLQQLLR